MTPKLPIQTQRKILKFEQRVFKLEQQIVRLKAKHIQEIAKLQAENQKLRNNPPVVTEEQRMKLIALRERLMNQSSKET